MIFTSYTYLLFLTAAFVIHWSLPVSARKLFLVAASYFFYCTWKWQFGFLLLGVSLFNWTYARWVLARAASTWTLALGVAANLSPLLYFKYSNFFLANATTVSRLFGSHWHATLLDIILPLGISFFTFQGVAYLFDVASGEEPLEHLLDFMLFKALWPQLIAGPIVRLHEMREQILTPRSLDYSDVAEGCQRILFGFFKKVALADNLAPSVEMVFFSNSPANAADAITATLGFGMQIYFDFSAYSDIAIGTARLFGFRLPENFNWPYVSASPREFWNRWHMTLSNWIRDYLFTPMVFASRRRPAMAPIWLLIAMALCGLWHGAAWTFVLWGVWHGILLAVNSTVLKNVFPPMDEALKAQVSFVRKWLGMIATFVLVHIGWVLFRARSIRQALSIMHAIAVFRGRFRPSILRENDMLLVGFVFAGMLTAQVIQSLKWPRLVLPEWSLPLLRPALYALMIVTIIVADRESQAFIYFQF
jgi:D-alanyl-lipoteichoic acid acyltransferase DltB (MBOAT superfamily)